MSSSGNENVAAAPLSDPALVDFPDFTETDDELDEDFLSSAFDSRATTEASVSAIPQAAGMAAPQAHAAASHQQQQQQQPLAMLPMCAFMVVTPVQFHPNSALASSTLSPGASPPGRVVTPGMQHGSPVAIGADDVGHMLIACGMQCDSPVSVGASDVPPPSLLPTSGMQRDSPAEVSSADVSPSSPLPATVMPVIQRDCAIAVSAADASPPGQFPTPTLSMQRGRASAAVGVANTPLPGHVTTPSLQRSHLPVAVGVADTPVPGRATTPLMQFGRADLPREPHPFMPPGSWDRPSKLSQGQAIHVVDNSPSGSRCVRFVRAARQPSKLRGGKGKVTTLTINHIPVDMDKHQLLALINETGFQARYNCVHLPYNYTEGTNQGHAFVNLSTPRDAELFFATWHGARVSIGLAQGAVLSLAVSNFQGCEACATHWSVAKMRRAEVARFEPFMVGY